MFASETEMMSSFWGEGAQVRRLPWHTADYGAIPVPHSPLSIEPGVVPQPPPGMIPKQTNPKSYG